VVVDTYEVFLAMQVLVDTRKGSPRLAAVVVDKCEVVVVIKVMAEQGSLVKISTNAVNNREE
jgi:hypothetical protein